MKRTGLTMAIVIAVYLTGCSSLKYEDKYAWNDGWRVGQIEEIGAGIEYSTKIKQACVTLPTSSSMFAKVKFRNSSRSEWRVVQISNQSNLKQNGSVLINIFDCKKTVIPKSS